MMDDTKPKTRMRKFAFLALKLIITALCIWYISGKIDFSRAAAAISSARPAWIALAALAFILSKILSAIRLNIYFRDIGLRLPQMVNLRLYLMGMFYNLFLPGSVSGDAYKVILLHRRYNLPYKKGTAAVLIDRISGLSGLGILLCFYALPVLHGSGYGFLPIVATTAGVAGLYLLTRFFFRDFLKSFLPTLFMALLVQGAQLVCAWLIMKALSIDAGQDEYLFLFLLSSVVSVLPLTIGGLGARELVFLQGSTYFGLHQEQAVTISLLFYLITVLTSAFGVIYIFKDPLGGHQIKKDS